MTSLTPTNLTVLDGKLAIDSNSQIFYHHIFWALDILPPVVVLILTIIHAENLRHSNIHLGCPMDWANHGLQMFGLTLKHLK